MTHAHSRRRPVNLTIREDLIEATRSLRVNASRAAEEGLAQGGAPGPGGGLAAGKPARHRGSQPTGRRARHAPEAPVAALMARFDVYRNAAGGEIPYLLDVQADLFADPRTRVVVPLVPQDGGGDVTLERLTPVLMIQGRPHLMMTTDLAAVHVQQLGEKVAVLEDAHVPILAALDFLFLGFLGAAARSSY